MTEEQLKKAFSYSSYIKEATKILDIYKNNKHDVTLCYSSGYINYLPCTYECQLNQLINDAIAPIVLELMDKVIKTNTKLLTEL